MKALRYVSLMMLMIIVCSPTKVLAHAELLVMIDDVAIEYDDFVDHPFIDENNRTQVPYRVTLEAYGAIVEWDQESYTAIAS